MSKIIDFTNTEEIQAPSGILKGIEPEVALNVLTWINLHKVMNKKKGYYYDIDGDPVITIEDAVALKASFEKSGWCDHDDKLSVPAWGNSTSLYQVTIYKELLAIAGLEEEDTGVPTVNT